MWANCERPEERIKAQDTGYFLFARFRSDSTWRPTQPAPLESYLSPKQSGPEPLCHSFRGPFWLLPPAVDPSGLCRAQTQEGHRHLLCLVPVIPRPPGTRRAGRDENAALWCGSRLSTHAVPSSASLTAKSSVHTWFTSHTFCSIIKFTFIELVRAKVKL